MTTLGIDLGTGSVKAAVVDDDGAVLSRASRAYRVAAPQPGWAESDPAEWLEATQHVIAQACEAQQPVAASFSGQMHGVVVTDEHLEPLRPAILWADTRSATQAQDMADSLGAQALSHLGSAAVAGFAATTIAWLGAHEPQVLARAAHILQPKDWLRARLGGDVATEPSDASGTLLFDVSRSAWSEEAIAWAGVEAAQLPRVRGSVAPAGVLHIGAVELPCTVGGADTACALAGLGLRPGDGFIAVGSGAQVVRVMDAPHLDASLRTHTFATAGELGAAWYRIGAMQSAGLTLTPALAWFDATIAEATAALAEGVRADDPIFVPYLSGERTPFMDPSLRGSWHGLSLATTRSAMLRSVLEAVAQAVSLGVAAVQAAGDRLPDVVPLVGGGTHDPVFRQLLADATGATLAVTEAPDAAVVGAAMLAAGRASAPHAAVMSGEVSPRAAVADLLAHRRETMVALVSPQESA